MKLYYSNPGNFFTLTTLVCADLANIAVEKVHMTDEAKNTKEWKEKSPTGLFPLLETADGTLIHESAAIAQTFAHHAPKSGIYGQTPFEAAKVDDWIAFTQGRMMKPVRPLFYDYFGHMKLPDTDKAAASKAFMDQIAFIEKELGNSFFLVGDNLTIADILIAASLSIPYQTWFGAEFWNKCPKTAAWLERVVNLPSFVRRFGYIKKGFEVEEEEAEDEMDDLFGDDEPAAPKITIIKKAKKEKPPAMSIVFLEVKPIDTDTNLDEVAKKIHSEVTMEGLFWKTEYRKEPIAFGIEKLIIAFSCEDEKVSVDDVVEKIEAFEDQVQSVEIQSFNKI